VEAFRPLGDTAKRLLDELDTVYRGSLETIFCALL
jgi:hypothetical protein